MLIEKILFDDFEKIVELNHRNNLNTLTENRLGKFMEKKSLFLFK